MTKLLGEVQTGCGRKKVVCTYCRKKRVCGFTLLLRFDEYNRKYDRNMFIYDNCAPEFSSSLS